LLKAIVCTLDGAVYFSDIIILLVHHHNIYKEKQTKKGMDEKKRMKMAIIAGASHAIKFRNQHQAASDDEILQHITKESENILKNIDEYDDF